VHGKDQDFGPGGACPDLPCCLDAVEERQRIVEDGDIRFALDGFANRVPTVGDLCNNLPVRVGFEDLSQTRSNHFMVVGNQDAGHVSQQPALCSRGMLSKATAPPQSEVMQIEIALSRFREFRTHRESIGRSRYGSPGSQLLSRAEPFSTFWRG